MPSNLIPVQFTGGINLLKDERRIRDDQLVATKNLAPTTVGILSTRPAASLLSIVNNETSAAYPIAIYMIPFSGFPQDLVYATRSNGGITSLLATQIGNFYSIVTKDMNVSTLYAPSFVAWRNTIYAFGDDSAGYTLKLKPDGSGDSEWSNFNFSGTGNGPVHPKTAGIYKNRMLYGNLGAGFESALVLSGTNTPDTIGDSGFSNANIFYAGRGDGDRIVAVREINQSSVAIASQTSAVVLKQNSAYILTGDLSEPGTPLDVTAFSLSKINYPCGCASEQTVVQTPYGLIWASFDDVWLFAAGQLPMRIGSNIRPALLATPPNLRYKWHAEYYQGFYRLAVFKDGQGPSDDSPCAQQYWLDLRNGPPPDFDKAEWWGPMEYNIRPPVGNKTPVTQTGTWCMGVSKKIESDSQLYALTPGLQPGNGNTNHFMWLTGFTGQKDYDGLLENSIISNPASSVVGSGYNVTQWAPLSVYVIDISTTSYVVNNDSMYKCIVAGTSGNGAGPTGYGITTGDGGCSWIYIGPASFWRPSENGDGVIHTELLTKVYDFGDPIIYKTFQGGEIDIRVQNDCQVNWTAIMDGGSSLSTDSENLLAYGYRTDLGVLDTDLVARQFQSMRLSPSSSSRPKGKLVQLAVQNVPGYLIVEGYNDKLVIAYKSSGGDPAANVEAITLTPGMYSTANDLSVMLQGLLTATSKISLFFQDAGAWTYTPYANGASLKIYTDGSKDVTLGLTAGVSERTAAFLGFQTGVVLSILNSNATNGISTASPIKYSLSPGWEIGGLVMKLRAIPRRPA